MYQSICSPIPPVRLFLIQRDLLTIEASSRIIEIERVASKTAASDNVNRSTLTDWRLDGVDFSYPATGRKALGEPSGAPESLQVLL